MIKVRDNELAIISEILKKYMPNYEFYVFGSRAKGNSHSFSDLDVAIKGNGKVDLLILANLRDEFQSSDLPFRVDIVDFHGISPEFQKVIEEDFVQLN